MIMTFYSASFATILWRFYAMTAVGIIAVASGQYYLAILCLPLLLGCLMGVSFKSMTEEVEEKTSQSSISAALMAKEAA